jgi:hypothetical protein
VLAAAFGTGQVAFSILWFALFVIEMWLMFSVFIDVFRSHDLRGWAKAAWVIFVLVVPLLGVLAYIVFRGDKLRAHQREAMDLPPGWGGDRGGRLSAHDVVATLHRLADLRDRGDISADEYRRLRDDVLSER